MADTMFVKLTPDWVPQLHWYQQAGANVLYFCFINPLTMEVPPAYAALARSRGTGQAGAVPADTVIIFAIGNWIDLTLIYQYVNDVTHS